MLQKIDPDIDIPDTTDIEEAFDGYTDKVENIVKLCEKAVDVCLYAAANASTGTWRSVLD